MMMILGREEETWGHPMSGCVRSILPLACLADGDPLSLQVLTQAVVQLSQAAQLQISHTLLVLLDLRWVADIARGILRHVVGV